MISKKKSELFDKAFEHFVILEIRAFLNYTRRNLEMFYWRTHKSLMEVDLIVDRSLAIEIKSTSLVQDKHLKGLRALKEEGLIKKYIVVSLDANERITNDQIYILPWKTFLNKLWNNKLL